MTEKQEEMSEIRDEEIKKAEGTMTEKQEEMSEIRDKISDFLSKHKVKILEANYGDLKYNRNTTIVADIDGNKMSVTFFRHRHTLHETYRVTYDNSQPLPLRVRNKYERKELFNILGYIVREGVLSDEAREDLVDTVKFYDELHKKGFLEEDISTIIRAFHSLTGEELEKLRSMEYVRKPNN
jgi:hypothetical protein